MIKIKWPLLLFTLFLIGCNSDSASTKTGFLSDTPGATPVSYEYDGARPPIQIQNAENKVVLIYSHGTSNSWAQEDCEHWGNDVPDSLLQQRSEQVLIFYLCSTATESRNDQLGEYIYRRLAEVEDILDELMIAGMEPDNIFLTGHSAGGWTSLMAASYFPEKFNAAIAFAPAFAGPRQQNEEDTQRRDKVIAGQSEDMLTAQERHALIFAYYNDRFERPEDLEFLVNAYSDTIRMVGYECVGTNGHVTHLRDCREEETIAIIDEFIND